MRQHKTPSRLYTRHYETPRNTTRHHNTPRTLKMATRHLAPAPRPSRPIPIPIPIGHWHRARVVESAQRRLASKFGAKFDFKNLPNGECRRTSHSLFTMASERIQHEIKKEETKAENSRICTVAALAAKAEESANPQLFICTVRPRDLPECWGVKFQEISLPGYDVDFNSIKKELDSFGYPQRRGYFTLPGGNKRQQRCTLIPKY